MKHHPKLVFISSIAAPHQVKFCYALQEYFDTEFWFYETPERNRGKWWQIDLGDRCKILKHVRFFKTGPLAEKYLALGLTRKLKQFNPDIVMLGGFSIPGNYLAYRWAKRNDKKTLVFTERSRDRRGVLRKCGIAWRLLHWLYRDVDILMTSADDAVEQFRDEFGFGSKVVAGRYSADLDAYFDHNLREPQQAYTYLFANRMTEIYNPLGALEIFSHVLEKYPGSKLLMNSSGELGDQCKAKISELKIDNSVEFLTDIQSWGDLHMVYSRSDILILPATFSNGNFTILEAMASGMGIVVSNKVLGIGEMVEDGVNGFNCEPTTTAFINRIEQYIHDPELFRKHATLNRGAVEPLSTHGTANFFAEIVKKRLSV